MDSVLFRRHEHDDLDVDPSVPIDSLLYAHIVIQMLVWGILLPSGMVLGLSKSRWHVPVQSLAGLLTLAGFQLGHHHRGRNFRHSAHASFAHFCFYYLLSQTAMGIFCRLHIYEKSLRPPIAKIHSYFGKAFPLISWVQIMLGFIALLGFCYDEPGDHFGQCLAHFIMGSSFQAYGIAVLVLMRYGAGFYMRHSMSQEYIESIVILIWGVVNTFTMHDFLHQRGVWSMKDMQHTSLGVIWVCAGALGIWLGRNGKRNIVPALVLAITGFAMSAHDQSSMLATKIHQIFGLSLIGAGAARIVEICFVLKDEMDAPGSRIFAFRHVYPLLLVVAGTTFESATEEQLAWIMSLNMDHVTYALLIFSGSFVLYLYACLLVSLYASTSINNPTSSEEQLPLFSIKRLFGKREKSQKPKETVYQALSDDGDEDKSPSPHPDSAEASPAQWHGVR